MDRERAALFALVVLGFDGIALLAVAALGPSHPLASLSVVGPIALLAPALAFWLLYRDALLERL